MYGTNSLDFGKTVVLLSCIFHVIMMYWIAVDPYSVVTSPHGGGWWAPLQQQLVVDSTDTDTTRNHHPVAVYPRMWATGLAL